MPGTLEAYYQEAGRAGRDGKPSTCVLLHAYPDRFTHEFFIDCAHPDRATVQQTWTFLRTHADRDGVIARSTDEVAQSLASKLGDRKVSAALRVLVATGACRVEAAALGRVSVRLLATPERIAGELTGRRAFDREVLRAFWKVAGRSLEDGASIDLERLPRRLGGAMGLIPVLKRLEAQQFVTWTPQGAGVRLDPRARDLRSPAVDWYGIDRRRATDLRRLDAIQRYAQTRYCRRAYILRYFGDPEVRSQCAACDRCLGTTEVLPPARTKQSVRGRPRPL
jgi:ATP-dependent DNA helicase RecQ